MNDSRERRGTWTTPTSEPRNRRTGSSKACSQDAIQVHPDVALREKVAQTFRVPDLFGPDRRLERIARTLVIPRLILAPTMAELAEDEQVYFHGFEEQQSWGWGHWNQNGHRIAGSLIADWLGPQLGK